MYRALSEFVIEGIKTTIPFHLKLMQNQKFIEGDYTTKFMESFDLTDL
jgi:acetyl-CoA carboxylase biotin carboxylase subunit